MGAGSASFERTGPEPPPSGAAETPATPMRLHVSGRIALAGGPEEACRAQVSGPDAIRIATEAEGRRGQIALCYLERIGIIPGEVGAVGAGGFLLIPHLCDLRRERVATRLAWLAARDALQGEQRDSPRIVPVHRAVTVRLADGLSAEGEIEDLSKSGARIRLPPDLAAPPWEAGMQVTVGKRYAVLVRAEGDAIAVRFRLPFTDETFNPSVVL